MRLRARLRVPVPILLVPALLMLASPAASAAVPPGWAPASTAAIHPGIETYTQGSQCTANFVYVDGAHVYLGQAAHCSSTDSSGETDGCRGHSLPLGTEVRVIGAGRPGTMVYNSWLAMQGSGEKDASTCAYNDLALIRIDPADVPAVNPSMPAWGGPVGLNTTGTASGDPVYSYGHSSLLLGLGALGPRQGQSRGDQGEGWSHIVLEYPPGIPGDSGSAFLDAHGNALGVLSTINIGTDFSNGLGDLSRELAYLHTHTPLTAVRIALGTEPFTRG
jgi:hypothetical protein